MFKNQTHKFPLPNIRFLDPKININYFLSCLDSHGNLIGRIDFLFLLFQIIANRNSSAKTVIQKSCNIDLLTETDQQVERLLMDGLLMKFPSHKY